MSRDRVLSDEELTKIWEATETLGFPFGPLYRLLILTGQRISEVSGMRRSEIDGNTWTIPAERSKNKKAHVVHLTSTAMSVIDEIPDQGFDLLFSTNGRKPPSGFSRAKARLDASIEPCLDPWRTHDLRRTATTGMAKIGIPPHIADAILNHKSGTISGVAAVYNRFEYLKEREHALEAWSAYVTELINGPIEKVVRIQT